MNPSDENTPTPSEPREVGAARILKPPKAIHTVVALALLLIFILGFVSLSLI
ncbi:MAG TPA: hypothetical protein VE262_18900 [Blastocatellia bacterium]|nr:hypothetical protein [Blastocatellia bacterium]